MNVEYVRQILSGEPTKSWNEKKKKVEKLEKAKNNQIHNSADEMDSQVETLN